MDPLPNGDTIGVRSSNENSEVQEEEEPARELIEIVVTEAVDDAGAVTDSPDRNSSPSSASAPLAESEESEQSDIEKMGSDEEPKHDEEAAVPRLQLLPIPSPGVSPNWSPSEKFDDKATKLDLSNLRLQPSKTSLLSAMDKIVKVPKPKIGGKTADDTKLRFFVGFLFLAVSLLIGGAHVLYYQHLGEVELFPHVTYEEATRALRFSSPETDSHVIELTLGVGISHKVKPFDCAHDPHGAEDHDHKCLEWYNLARLNIAHYTIKDTINCYNIYWQSLSKSVSPMDCFPTGAEYSHLFHEQDTASNETEGVKEESLSGNPLRDQGQWYGGGESLQAAWPLQKGHIKLSPFVTGDEGQTEWGNAIRKYFVNSRGVSLKIADHTPLFVSLNDPPKSGLCLQARFDDFAYYYHRFNLPRLNYTVCTAKNVRKLHYELLPKSFWDGHKQRDIDTLHHLLKTPIWQVPPDETFSHEALERYIERTVGANKRQGQEDSGFGQGYLLLDYHWQKHMGDLKFDPANFPNPNETVRMVKDHGLKLVLTVSPFISTESKNFAPGVNNRIFVGQRKSDERVPALTWYKDISSCGMLDMTSNKTAFWFRQQLRSLVQDLDIDLNAVSHHDETSENEELLTSSTVDTPVTFFLQTGNSFHTPSYFKFDVDLDNPDLFRDYFVGHTMEEVPVIGVSGASSSRPKAPAFVFMSPLEPKWSHLRSIIPNVLQLSVIGYPFINPGPVGGVPNPSQPESNSTMTRREELELYVRWWQLNTFLPMLHFVKPPTSFNDPVMNGIAKSLKSIRTKVVLPELIRSANEAMHSSAPIIRPLWMVDPMNPVTHSIDDQFLVGDKILVAPVLDHGVRERNVYLPKLEDDVDDTVIWKRGTDGTFYKGGKWLNGTKVELHEVLYFVRQKADSIPGLGQV